MKKKKPIKLKGDIVMSQRYWNDLAEEERQLLENEWYSSNWYSNALKNSSSTKYQGTYYLLLFIEILAFILCACSIMGMSDEYSEIPIIGESPLLFLILSFIIMFFCLFGIYQCKFKSVNEEIEQEKEKWLLEKYNIKM